MDFIGTYSPLSHPPPFDWMPVLLIVVLVCATVLAVAWMRK
jgi:hypothetical protein